MSTPHRLSTWYTGTPQEDVILVRNTGPNPIGSCIYKAPGIKPGATGYQTRSTIDRFPYLVPVTEEEQAPVTPAAPAPLEPAPSLADGSWAAPTEPPPPPDKARVLSAREAVAFIEQAATRGEYDHLRADPRRSVKDAIADRDMDLAAARRGA